MASVTRLLERFPPRLCFLLMFAGCAGLLGFGYFLQYVRQLDPCPLCIFQRVAFLAVAVTALVATLHHPRGIGSRIYAGLLGVFSITGAGIAARQIWLQHLPPDQVPECGPGLEYMLDVFPLLEVLRTVLRGSGDCAKVDWTFLSLSIADWSFAAFVGLALLSLAVAVRPVVRTGDKA